MSRLLAHPSPPLSVSCRLGAIGNYNVVRGPSHSTKHEECTYNVRYVLVTGNFEVVWYFWYFDNAIIVAGG